MTKQLVLSQRDISVFYMLHLHTALAAKQLSAFCFSNISYETARKRLRRLHQSGYLDSTVLEQKEKGRPENIYFLNRKAAKALAAHKNISEKVISIGTPNSKHYDYLFHLAEIHLAFLRMAQKEKIQNFDFITKRANKTEYADATITYTDKEGHNKTIYLVLDTGNLRPTRHWFPKITSLLKANELILIITVNKHRLDTLRQWTTPLVEESGTKPELCLFIVYDDIIQLGISRSTIYSIRSYHNFPRFL